MTARPSFPFGVERWIELLRSGDFPESRGDYLCEIVAGVQRYTVFGVLCESARMDGVCNLQHGDGSILAYVSETQATKRLIPKEVWEWSGLKMFCGDFEIPLPDGTSRTFCLRELGQMGFSFLELAEIIEANPDGLFRPSMVFGGTAVASGTRFDLDSRLLTKLTALPH